MSFAMTGLTHCADCGAPLGMNEYYRCNSCQEQHDILEKEMEEEKKKEILKAEIVEEVRDVVGNDLIKELAKSKFNSPIKEIYVGTMKPNDMKWDDWYAEIGHQVIQEYEKGNDGVMVSFVKLEEKEVDDDD